MIKIKTYKVSFAKSGVYQEHIVETDRDPAEISEWYLNQHEASAVIGIRDFDGITRPGQPIVRI